MTSGKTMYQWAKDLFPINRSLTGNGVRQTLDYLKNIIPELTIHEVPSHTPCFDWQTPKEWNCSEAYILTPDGRRVCDYATCNLHLVGYSTPIEAKLTFEELKNHLHFLEDQPSAIPYITSYYQERWGFCLTYDEFKTLPKDGKYTVVIKSELKDGFMSYGEVYLPGKRNEEIFLSTYICHPSMANNELSGPVVTTAIISFIKQFKCQEYSYRIVFIPETIGSIYYLSLHVKEMKKNVVAGFNITTIGDNYSYSYVQTRYGNTLSDKVISHVLQKTPHKVYTFLNRGSDERQYCAPGIDLPITTVCRSKFGTYPQYHTSLDNLDFISPEGLYGGYMMVKSAIELLEKNHYYCLKTLCEPQLGKRGLYPTLSAKKSTQNVRLMMNFLAYCDGKNDLIDIANTIGVEAKELYEIVDKLLQNELIGECRQ